MRFMQISFELRLPWQQGTKTLSPIFFFVWSSWNLFILYIVCPGLYTCMKSWNILHKLTDESELYAIYKDFLLPPNFVPEGLFALDFGLIVFWDFQAKIKVTKAFYYYQIFVCCEVYVAKTAEIVPPEIGLKLRWAVRGPRGSLVLKRGNRGSWEFWTYFFLWLHFNLICCQQRWSV